MARLPGAASGFPGRARTVLLALVLAGLLLLAASRTWVVAPVPTGPAAGSPQRALEVAGSSAAPVVTALALVGLAGAAALSTVRRAGLVLTAALLVVAGLGAAAGAAAVLVDPTGSAAAAVAAATGLTGGDPVPATRTAWPALALVPALGLAAVGALAGVRGRRWRASGRFEATTADGATRARAEPSRSALWDDLSRGDDPTTGAGGRRGDPA